jgi:hypothetical protein
MKKLVLFLLIIPLISLSQELTLFDSEGEAVAYINYDDQDNTIYLWNGYPVAYLSSEGDYYNVYGFNGNHLGWFEEGIIMDHSGNSVGFIEGSVSNVYTQYESYKSYKQNKPYKSYKNYEPNKPYNNSSFSSEPLVLFLKRGR